MSKTPVTPYPGDAIDVTWDERLCIGIGECVRAKGDLFVSGREPWCIPDLAEKREVREVVERCPSGALAYTDKAGVPEQPAAENTVMVMPKGPLLLRGELAIADAPQDMPGVQFRAALCRCGHSRNKPFCDNMHEQAGFDDLGAVGETGPGLTVAGGPLQVEPEKDGPLVLTGNLSILASSGRVAWQGSEVALCRCGHSKNKPFCDGSHEEAGFRSE